MNSTQGRGLDGTTASKKTAAVLHSLTQLMLMVVCAAQAVGEAPWATTQNPASALISTPGESTHWLPQPVVVEPAAALNADAEQSDITRLPVPEPNVESQPQRWHTSRGVTAKMTSSFVESMDQGGWEQQSTSAQPTSFRVADVMEQLTTNGETAELPLRLETPWWREYLSKPIDTARQPRPISLDQLIQLALVHSAQIRVYEKTPEIRHTSVAEANAAFDWTQFLDARWQDISDPVGSSLTVGGTGNRFKDNNLQSNLGFRRRNDRGGQLEVFQRLGHQNTNSQFFIPNDQGTARFSFGYTHPLLRGRGKNYNRSLIVLASIDAQRATDEYQRQLQQHLLEIARSYWTLYLERSTLTQKVSLYLKSLQNEQQIRERQAIDAQRSQLIQATAAVESRKSDLIRARAAVQNAETKLRALINDPGLDEHSEIIPLDVPTLVSFSPDLQAEFATAIRHRPEIQAALKEIRAACVRTKMAKHEMLPVLNLVTETYVSGLQGQSRVGDAWLDQFRVGEPSYTIGLEWEVAVGRRAASAALRRRQLESIQLGEKYRSTLELVKAEVEVAVREVVTSYQELAAKDRARQAAIAEAETLEIRWRALGGRDNNASLMFESVVQAQQRVTQAEHDVSTSLLTYSLSLINLRHANGTLLQMTIE